MTNLQRRRVEEEAKVLTQLGLLNPDRVRGTLEGTLRVV